LKPVIVLQYLSLIHYRRSVFDLIFKDGRLDFKIICGKDSPYSAMKNYVPASNQDVTFIENVKLLGTKLLLQRKIVSVTSQKKPDVVILLGVNPLILSSLYSALYFSLVKKTKVFWWGHGTLGRQGWVGKLFRKQFYKLSDGILVYGEGGKANLIANGIRPEKIHVVNNCLNEEDYGFDHSLGRSRGKFNILFSGRLTVAKRVDELVELGCTLKRKAIDFQIDILGVGPDLERVRGMIRALKLEEFVVLHGAKYGVEAHDIFSKATLFVHPGPIGLSVIHALSFGLPVITSNDGGRLKPEVEAITDGVNGSFYAVGDLESLVLRTLEWKEKIEADRSGIIHVCQTSVAKYTPKVIADNIISVVTN
jgi:glycosyltransferase involved in cell wall biosynthesis